MACCYKNISRCTYMRSMPPFIDIARTECHYCLSRDMLRHMIMGVTPISLLTEVIEELVIELVRGAGCRLFDYRRWRWSWYFGKQLDNFTSSSHYVSYRWERLCAVSISMLYFTSFSARRLPYKYIRVSLLINTLWRYYMLVMVRYFAVYIFIDIDEIH